MFRLQYKYINYILKEIGKEASWLRLANTIKRHDVKRVNRNLLIHLSITSKLLFPLQL